MNQGELSKITYPREALQDGKLLLPDTVRFIRIDVGLAAHASHSAWFLHLYKDRGSIGIEPDPRCIEKLIHGSDLYPEVKRVIINKQMIMHHNKSICDLESRFVLVNCAISDVEALDYVPFYLTDAQLAGDKNQYKVFGTSSLHMPTTEHPSSGYHIQNVMAMPLSEVIKAIPDRFEFIEEIKIDTEGHDYQVVKSAGEFIKRAVYVTVESGSNAPKHHHGLVVDSMNSTRSVIEEYMESMGFRIDFQDSTDQRYINIRLKHLVNLHGLNTDGDPLILEGKSSLRKRLRFRTKKLVRDAGKKITRILKRKKSS